MIVSASLVGHYDAAGKINKPELELAVGFARRARA
jgi:hypothetical protein